MTKGKASHGTEIQPRGSNLPRVTRSSVPAGKDYSEYRDFLRYDFYFSCAYCMTSEAEGAAIRFTIDHYEPQKKRPDLAHDYSNLMYACDKCNQLKGDRQPTSEQMSLGYKFYRMDADVFIDHFTVAGVRVEHKTPTGYYTIQALDLNRLALRRLREIRERLYACDDLIAQGLLGLQHFHMDRLPPPVRGRLLSAVRQANGTVGELASAIDSLLRDNLRSPLIDHDPEAEARARERSKALKELAVLYPGNWHG